MDPPAGKAWVRHYLTQYWDWKTPLRSSSLNISPQPPCPLTMSLSATGQSQAGRHGSWSSSKMALPPLCLLCMGEPQPGQAPKQHFCQKGQKATSLALQSGDDADRVGQLSGCYCSRNSCTLNEANPHLFVPAPEVSHSCGLSQLLPSPKPPFYSCFWVFFSFCAVIFLAAAVRAVMGAAWAGWWLHLIIGIK